MILIGGNIGVFGADRGKALVPERHRMIESIGLRRAGHMPAPAPPSEVEGIAQDAVGAPAGEDRLLDDDFVLAGPGPTADLGIFAFRVFAHHPEIDVAASLVAQGRSDARQQPHRTQIDVLLELAPDRQQQPPQRDMIRYPGKTDRAEEHRIMIAQPV